MSTLSARPQPCWAACILFGIVAVTLLGALRLDTTAYFSVICSGALLLAIIVDRLLRSGEPETASD